MKSDINSRCAIRRTLSAVALFIIIVVGGRQADAQDVDGLTAFLAIERAFVRAIEKAETSVVAIARYKLLPDKDVRDRPRPFPGRRPPRPSNDPSSPDFIPNEFGSGVIVARNKQAYILTNYHVVRGGPVVGAKVNANDSRLYVRLADRRGFDARILAADPRSDLAILKLESDAPGGKPAKLKPIKFGDATNVKKGQFVLALGNPYALARDGSASASWGMISNMSRFPAPAGPLNDVETLKKETIHRFGTLLQVDTRQSVGTSGGALINVRGELIGITTSLAALEGYEKSVGYAIPINVSTRKIIDALLQGLEVEYGFLGIAPVDVPAEELKIFSGSFQQSTAAKARTVFPNSPASRGGLASQDIILAVNKIPIHGRYDLMREIGLIGPGQVAQVRVWREAARQIFNYQIVLGKWPVHDEDAIIATKSRFKPWNGLKVDYPTARQKFMQDPFRFPPAVVVMEIEADTPADSAKLEVGDFITQVNQTPVRTPKEFHDAIDKSRQKQVTLRLLDGRRLVIPK